ncbi:MAG: CBS domain-containing protein [Deltaproteobacteria bacterium]|nr:CBS domain-containing protein [Deltaproteobacteria bacterium]
MFVSDWMKRTFVTIAPDASISDAVKLMKDNRIKHIPVVEKEHLKGLISNRDIREFTPSKATALDMYELHYLLAKAKVREIMKEKVCFATPDTPIEEAAMIMYDKDISCLPVLDGDRLVGLISDKDIFRALIDITGVRYGGHRIFLDVEDMPGSIKDVADIVRECGFNLQSILTSYEKVSQGFRHIVIRAKGSGQFGNLEAELTESFGDVNIKKG